MAPSRGSSSARYRAFRAFPDHSLSSVLKAPVPMFGEGHAGYAPPLLWILLHAWGQPIHEIADHSIDFISADLRKALSDRLRPEPRSGIALVLPKLLETLGKRHRAGPVE